MSRLSMHFFQKRRIDGQQIYKEILKLTNHQANVNQNHNEMSPCPCQNIMQKDQK